MDMNIINDPEQKKAVGIIVNSLQKAKERANREGWISDEEMQKTDEIKRDSSTSAGTTP